MERIVLATGNKGKIREFKRAFSHMNITCVPVKDIVDVPEPEETGTTFMENAIQGLPLMPLMGHLVYTPHAMRAFTAMTTQIMKN